MAAKSLWDQIKKATWFFISTYYLDGFKTCCKIIQKKKHDKIELFDIYRRTIVIAIYALICRL